MIGIQILPTLGCNFQCIYCYKSSQSNTRFMSKEVMDAIVTYVKKTIKPTTKHLSVSWYGGEPLLAMKQIEYLSSSFIDICNKNNINEYFSHITTNGYLLTRKNLNTLLKFKINNLQVTIDGPEDIHNKRRVLKNGTGTYKRILTNLKYAISRNINITFRINRQVYGKRIILNLRVKESLNLGKYHYFAESEHG
ncbi:MAG: radical SAM protein [Acidobacteriota bacterium]